MAIATMTLTLEPAGQSITINRRPSLGTSHRRSRQQSILETDLGSTRVFTRRIPRLSISIAIDGISLEEQGILESFIWNVLLESANLFTLIIPPVIPAEIQAGDTFNGAPIQAGDVIKCNPQATGTLLEAGVMYRLQDQITLTGCRLVPGSYRSTDAQKNAASVAFDVEQELPGP